MSHFKRLFGSVLSLILALLTLLTIRWALVEPYVIPSGSMIPSLLVNDHILVNKLSYGLRLPFSKKWLFRFSPPNRGDVVVFRSKDDDNYFMIKRVVALSGDDVSYSAKGELFVNKKKVESSLIENHADEKFKAPNNVDKSHAEFYEVTQKDLGKPFSYFKMYREELGGHKYRTLLQSDGFRWPQESFVVPNGELFVMGDNRDTSRDSRVWGTLPIDNLLGKALFVWLSCDEALADVSFLCHPKHLRWRRFFHFIN